MEIANGDFVCSFALSRGGNCHAVSVQQAKIGETCGPKDLYQCKVTDAMACMCSLPPWDPQARLRNKCYMKEDTGNPSGGKTIGIILS